MVTFLPVILTAGKLSPQTDNLAKLKAIVRKMTLEEKAKLAGMFAFGG